MTKILAFSGRAQSGKDTCCKIVEEIYIQRLFELNFLQQDELHKSGIDIIINIDGKDCPLVKHYSFAYWLKFVCHKILGLTYEQCYGDNDDKNTLTNLLWENAPNYIPNPAFPTYARRGRMTAREVLQWWGTEIFRKAYINVWMDATIRQIKEEQPILALISDLRFKSEFDAVKKEGGYVVRLTRNIDVEATHQSEVELDQENFNWKLFDYIIDNHDNSYEDLSVLKGDVQRMLSKLEII